MGRDIFFIEVPKSSRRVLQRPLHAAADSVVIAVGAIMAPASEGRKRFRRVVYVSAVVVLLYLSVGVVRLFWITRGVENVRGGMTVADVEAIVGRPYALVGSPDSEEETRFYSISFFRMLRVRFKKGHVFQIDELPKRRTWWPVGSMFPRLGR